MPKLTKHGAKRTPASTESKALFKRTYVHEEYVINMRHARDEELIRSVGAMTTEYAETLWRARYQDGWASMMDLFDDPLYEALASKLEFDNRIERTTHAEKFDTLYKIKEN